jgi:hypothetical protein
MRTIAKVDENQPLIVDCLRRCGCLVLVLSQLGHGVPDLLVGTPRGLLILIEIKDGKKSPSARKLTPDQALWHAAWRRYPLFQVCSVAEAVEAIGHECREFDIHRNGSRTCTGCNRELAA